MLTCSGPDNSFVRYSLSSQTNAILLTEVQSTDEACGVRYTYGEDKILTSMQSTGSSCPQVGSSMESDVYRRMVSMKDLSSVSTDKLRLDPSAGEQVLSRSFNLSAQTGQTLTPGLNRTLVTNLAYDNEGRVTSASYSLANSLVPRQSSVVYESLPSGSRLSTYDSLGLRQLDRSTNILGSLTSVTDPEGRTSQLLYDNQNRVVCLFFSCVYLLSKPFSPSLLLD
jgi:YD repeat-containing protein